MANLWKHHKELTNGVGKCSRPMWRMGMPAGFCDEPAYGRQWEVRYRGELPYCGGLACPGHGGPKLADVLRGRTVIRFDGPPGPEAGRFVEVERDGWSINAGTWMQDGDYWLLVLDDPTGDAPGGRDVSGVLSVLAAIHAIGGVAMMFAGDMVGGRQNVTFAFVLLIYAHVVFAPTDPTPETGDET